MRPHELVIAVFACCFACSGGSEVTAPKLTTRIAFATSASGPGDLSAWPQSGGLPGLAGADAVCEHLSRPHPE
jgi:hypothetical protein